MGGYDTVLHIGPHHAAGIFLSLLYFSLGISLLLTDS